MHLMKICSLLLFSDNIGTKKVSIYLNELVYVLFLKRKLLFHVSLRLDINKFETREVSD